VIGRHLCLLAFLFPLSLGSIISNIGFSLLIGYIYWQQPSDLKGLQNRVGAFFFLTMTFLFSNLTALELFIHERAVFVHEKSSGYYRTSAYFLARSFADLIREYPYNISNKSSSSSSSGTFTSTHMS